MEKNALRIRIFNALISDSLSEDCLKSVGSLSTLEKEILFALLFNGRLLFPMFDGQVYAFQIQSLIDTAKSYARSKYFRSNLLFNKDILIFDIEYLQYQVKRDFPQNVQEAILPYLDEVKKFAMEQKVGVLPELSLQENILKITQNNNLKVVFLVAELFAFFGWDDTLHEGMLSFFQKNEINLINQAYFFQHKQ